MREEFPERHLKNYVWKFFYFNKKDPRLFPPKLNPDYGITVNFAHPIAVLCLCGFIAFFAFVLTMIVIHQK